MKRMLKKVCNWWNQNATKRWLLTLDRLCLCWIADLGFESFKEAGGLAGEGVTQADIIFFAAVLLFLILYTPSYMFPDSDSPVLCSKRKEP